MSRHNVLVVPMMYVQKSLKKNDYGKYGDKPATPATYQIRSMVNTTHSPKLAKFRECVAVSVSQKISEMKKNKAVKLGDVWTAFAEAAKNCSKEVANEKSTMGERTRAKMIKAPVFGQYKEKSESS